MTSLDDPHDESRIREQFAAAQCPGVTEGSRYFTTSQQAAMGRLDALAEVFERMADAKPGGFGALTKPLIIGQTGSGKST